MTDSMGCPADTCSFEGSIFEVVDHVIESVDEFRYDAHLTEGRRLQENAREARDHGGFDEAIEDLEGALHNFQCAKLFADDVSSIESRCREMLQLIDNLVNQAENATDAGDKAHFESDSNFAGQKYEEAVDALEEARTLATELAPDRVAGIDRHLRSVQVRQESLELSEPHQTVRDLVAAAREHAAAGDRAFHDSEYEVALKEYENARDQYESLADSLQEFSFDESIADSIVCDVCRQRFDGELDSWRINLGVSLQVCPACVRFGSDGNLPNPRTVATEYRAIVENIENIRDGDVGLDWTSDAPLQSDRSEDVGTDGDRRDTRQMLMQLVGLCQQLGAPPSAAELDENTDFGYLDYRNEFGSLSEALQAAGFESQD
ncbi:homing endonuclease associated repeat-containing protein [Natronorubrum aibiense]|uniref:Uncharacterized protein n=1 Tax=Natronorubrum aibiense TaxID=348826 RepID=A0A5P9P829_9EURY|nr:hypothetical protein [Natronorubrum aibiense]QFU84266.1 hypothetical protein GCU68_16920 [Natronorubrum aibiense]